jgi:hypothetical protein
LANLSARYSGFSADENLVVLEYVSHCVHLQTINCAGPRRPGKNNIAMRGSSKKPKRASPRSVRTRVVQNPAHCRIFRCACGRLLRPDQLPTASVTHFFMWLVLAAPASFLSAASLLQVAKALVVIRDNAAAITIVFIPLSPVIDAAKAREAVARRKRSMAGICEVVIR